MNEDFFRQNCFASQLQLQRLRVYADLLRQWNSRINLIAKSTEQHIWQRHFLDSAALINHLPEQDSSVLDLGSGAGFPGMVLCILRERPITLVESLSKKVVFLNEVKRHLELSCDIVHARAETLKLEEKFPVITARAVAPLITLWQWTENLRTPQALGLFLKGQQSQEELKNFQRSFPNLRVSSHKHPWSEGYIIKIQS